MAFLGGCGFDFGESIAKADRHALDSMRMDNRT